MELWWPQAFDRERWSIEAGVHPDTVLARLAAAQHGVAHVRQLHRLGVTADHLRRRCESGHVRRVRTAVYGLGGQTLAGEGHRMSAALACRGRLAGWSLATHAGVLPAAGRAIDVVIPSHRRVRQAGLSVRRVDLAPSELAVVNGIPGTTVARMLLDLSATADADIVEWAWRQAIYRKLLDIEDVRRLLTDRHGERGTVRLRALYEQRAVIVGDVRNRFELAMVAIVRDAGLPEPACNQVITVDGRRLRPDLLVREVGLAIESDGRDGHEDPEFVVSDDERDALYRRAGLEPKRYGYWEATRERGRLVAELGVFRGRRPPDVAR